MKAKRNFLIFIICYLAYTAIYIARLNLSMASPEMINKVVMGEKTKPRKVVFNAKKLDSYFAPNMTSEDIESIIVRLLDECKEKGGGS